MGSRTGLLIPVLAGLTFVLLYPIFVPQKMPRYATATTCMSQIRQASLALIMYATDEGGLPARDHWVDLCDPYAKSWDIFRCPLAPKNAWGYAFNGGLEGKKPEKISKPSAVPMVYDSVNPVRNASDLFTSLPAVPRHKKNIVGYADGHAKAL